MPEFPAPRMGRTTGGQTVPIYDPAPGYHPDASMLAQRKEQAGGLAQQYLGQLAQMARPNLAEEIWEGTYQQRLPGLQRLITEGQRAYERSLPAVYRTMAEVPIGAGSMSPEATMAAALGESARRMQDYNLSRAVREAYGTGTQDIFQRALQSQQMQAQMLSDLAQQYRGVESNLADRLFRGTQANEQLEEAAKARAMQQAQFEWQRGFEERKFDEDVRRFGLEYALRQQAMARASGGGGGGGGGTAAGSIVSGILDRLGIFGQPQQIPTPSRLPAPLPLPPGAVIPGGPGGFSTQYDLSTIR